MHSHIIKQTLQFCWHLLSDKLHIVVDVLSELFDDIHNCFLSVETQIFPENSTVAGTLLDFEHQYACYPGIGDTLEQRRNRIIAAIRANGDLNRSYFHKIAEGLGYAIGSGIKSLEIQEGEFLPFRADYGRADLDAICDNGLGGSLYTVTVLGTGVEGDSDLIYLFNRQRLVGVEIIFVNL